MSSPTDDFPRSANPAGAESAVSEHLREWVGTIYSVPDALWGLSLVVSDDHPGVCLGGDEGAAVFVQGTDAEHDWHRRGRERVLPSESNGLYKETSFRLEPRRFRWRRVQLLHPERYVGRLDDADLDRLRSRLDELLDAEAGH